MTETFHDPVLRAELLHAAEGGGARRAIDATLGDGGHTAAFIGAGIEVIGIDQDPEAIRRAAERLGNGVELIHGAFDEVEVLHRVAAFDPDFALLDLGLSSRQLDDPRLGFSFRPGVHLDMRMNPTGPDAAQYLETSTVEELSETFRTFGDEPRGRRLAKEVIRRRERGSMRTSDDLVNAIRAVLGPSSGPSDFARLFQALRIRVNDELGRLARALPAYRDRLSPGGVLAVISYHSGEDRIVKHAFREWARTCVCPPAYPICVCRGRALGEVVTRKPIIPGDAEIASNPRARSARMRLFRVVP
jgi:16S rRNA (cytosine1402-N4)-methyltransferase